MTQAQTTVRVGQMPGRINDYAVAVGTSVAEVLRIAGLSASGKEIKIDGVVSNANATISATTNLILLSEQVKGNSVKTVRVGQMPGRINDYAVNVGDTVASVLALAGLNPKGKEIKIDGVVSNASATITPTTNLILLSEQVKGN
jgi:hypothetical protein